MKGYVLSCFDYSTNMVRPWADAGYQCYCVDTQHPQGYSDTDHPLITMVGADMLYWQTPMGKCKIAFFAPPCTDVAVSGARWMQSKGLRALIDALKLFERSVHMAEILGCPWMIENPVSTVSTYWRKPDHTFHPWHYGDLYTKLTCLWTGGGFIMPKPIHTEMPEEIDKHKIHYVSPSKDRANIRSETPMGFAQAVFDANRGGQNDHE